MINVSLSGNSSSLSTNLYPEIELDEQYDYSCCLLDFSIQFPALKAVLTEKNNSFAYFYGYSDGVIELPTGEHETQSIAMQINKQMREAKIWMKLRFDRNTMKYHIEASPNLRINFRKFRDSVASIFGFDEANEDELTGNVSYEADYSIAKPFDVETIRVDCDLVNGGSFHDGIGTHTLHEFYPPPISNYKMIEQPDNLIYLPVVKQRISSINITLTDQSGKPIDLVAGVQVHCRISVKRN